MAARATQQAAANAPAAATTLAAKLALLAALLLAAAPGAAPLAGPLPLEASPYDNVVPVFGAGAAAAREDGRGYEAVVSPEATNFVRGASVPTYGLKRYEPGQDGTPDDGLPHFMVPAEIVHAAERAEDQLDARGMLGAARQKAAPQAPPPGAQSGPHVMLPRTAEDRFDPDLPGPLKGVEAAAPPGDVAALAETDAEARTRHRFIGKLLGLKKKSTRTLLGVGGAVAAGVAVAKATGFDKTVKKWFGFGSSQAKTTPKSPFTKESIATAVKALPFDPAKLAPRPPPPPGRKLDPNFDKLDMPEKCPGRCSGNGKCLIDKSRLVPQGNVEVYPYKCVCAPDWTGVACQTRVDQYIRWFESSGTTPFPKCCPVAPSQWQVPSGYDKLPTYQNPYSVSNCDPQLSVDSRPDPSGRPPCWRPLSAAGLVTPGDRAKKAEASALLEEGAFAAAAGHPKPEDVIAANEEEKRRLAERIKAPVAECCLPCDFDFWSQVNSRPKNPLQPGGGRDYVRALERQRVMEQFGGQAVLRELKRREKMRELTDRARRREDDPFAASLLELEHGLTPEQQAARDAARADRRDAREAARRRLRGGEAQTDPQNPGGARAPACVICPIPAAEPFGVDMAKYNKEKGVDDKENNRFGKFLRRGKQRPSPPCCNTCPSAFWIRTVSKDTDPFWGPEKVPKKVTFPAGGDPAGGDQQQGQGQPVATPTSVTATATA